MKAATAMASEKRAIDRSESKHLTHEKRAADGLPFFVLGLSERNVSERNLRPRINLR